MFEQSLPITRDSTSYWLAHACRQDCARSGQPFWSGLCPAGRCWMYLTDEEYEKSYEGADDKQEAIQRCVHCVTYDLGISNGHNLAKFCLTMIPIRQ